MKREPSLKSASLSEIRAILIEEYGVSTFDAALLIQMSGIEKIFDRDAEVAAHTSYKTWARRAYAYAKQLVPSQTVKTLAHKRVARTKVNKNMKKMTAIKRVIEKNMNKKSYSG